MKSHTLLYGGCLVFGLILAAESYVHPVQQADYQSNELMAQEMAGKRDLANRLLHRLMDVAYETFKDLGGSEDELKEIQHKRSRITACYFQAITCF